MAYLSFMVEYLTNMEENDDGCFYQQAGAKAKWGRGNDWFASGVAEILREQHSTPSAELQSRYETIPTRDRKMMAGLPGYQITGNTTVRTCWCFSSNDL